MVIILKWALIFKMKTNKIEKIEWDKEHETDTEEWRIDLYYA